MPSIGGGCLIKYFGGTTGGTLLGAVGPSVAGANSVAALQGLVHTINISSDSAASTTTVYDGLSSSGTVVAKITTSGPASTPTCHFLDLQLQVGLFVVISGSGAPGVMLTYE